MGQDWVMDWQFEVSAILRETPELEFSLRRDLLFARHGFAMPFPLREDFLDHLEESRHLPIWVHWDSWQKLLSGPSDNLEGFWERENELICVRGDLVHWLTIEGQPRAVQQTGNGRYSIGLGDGTSCAAWLEDGLLRWDDGDVWHRPAASRLAAVTRSLEPWPLCVLLRSLADSRDFSASVLENRYVQLRRHPTSESGRLAESYALLLKLVPVDVGLRERFLTAVAQLPRLVEQRRRRYTPELIRQSFHVLHVGHSFLHLHSAVLPDGEQAIMGFLQRCTSMDLFRRVLCNDIAQLHPEDLLEDLFTMPPSSLAQLLPLAHFDAVVIRNCPVQLSTLALQNFASMLRDGGVLIAFPAYLDVHAEVPQSLNSCWLEPSASEEGALLFGDLNGAVWKIGLLQHACPLDCRFFKCLLESETCSVNLRKRQKEREHDSDLQALLRVAGRSGFSEALRDSDLGRQTRAGQRCGELETEDGGDRELDGRGDLLLGGSRELHVLKYAFASQCRDVGPAVPEIETPPIAETSLDVTAPATLSLGLTIDVAELLVMVIVTGVFATLPCLVLARSRGSVKLWTWRSGPEQLGGGSLPPALAVLMACGEQSAKELGRRITLSWSAEGLKGAVCLTHAQGWVHQFVITHELPTGGEPREQLRMLSAECKEASPLAAAQLAESALPGERGSPEPPESWILSLEGVLSSLHRQQLLVVFQLRTGTEEPVLGLASEASDELKRPGPLKALHKVAALAWRSTQLSVKGPDGSRVLGITAVAQPSPETRDFQRGRTRGKMLMFEATRNLCTEFIKVEGYLGKIVVELQSEGFPVAFGGVVPDDPIAPEWMVKARATASVVGVRLGLWWHASGAVLTRLVKPVEVRQ
ncbi:CHLP [Symbiodinium sp. CCMP2592]|nr:CHLP [Symbiodinium sp. CCMP2592]